MTYKSIELDREFATQKDMFLALKENKAAIIQMKKSIIKQSEGFLFKPLKDDDTLKGLNFIEDGYIYPVINTTNYQDSHKDVHLNGLWKKSLQEQQGKIFYLSGHSMKISDVIAWPEDVKAFTKMIKWSDLGRDYKGETQGLIYKIAIDKIVNDAAKQIIKDKRPVENSISMIYVNIDLGINSNDKEFKNEKIVYDKYASLVANQDVLSENGYAWFIKEAKIAKEGSMVLAGSNDVTPILGAGKSTPTSQPSEDTDKRKLIINFLKTF